MTGQRVLPPRRGKTHQPRATPWVRETTMHRRPERARQPCRGRNVCRPFRQRRERFLGMEKAGKTVVAEVVRLRSVSRTPEFSRIRLRRTFTALPFRASEPFILRHPGRCPGLIYCAPSGRGARPDATCNRQVTHQVTPQVTDQVGTKSAPSRRCVPRCSSFEMRLVPTARPGNNEERVFLAPVVSSLTEIVQWRTLS